MKKEHSIVQQVELAQQDVNAADDLIRSYQPFIKAEVSRFINRYADNSDDEVSVGMMAFYEAIQSYSKLRGSFLSFASMMIKNRLIDFVRHENRHDGHVSLDTPLGEGDDDSLIDTIVGTQDAKELVRIEATQKEINEFVSELSHFGLSLNDITETSPKQERTLAMCHDVIRYINTNNDVLDYIMQSKKLPITLPVENTTANKKTLERHRKYILSMVLVLTNGFDILRGHLAKVIRMEDNEHEVYGNGMQS